MRLYHWALSAVAAGAFVLLGACGAPESAAPVAAASSEVKTGDEAIAELAAVVDPVQSEASPASDAAKAAVEATEPVEVAIAAETVDTPEAPEPDAASPAPVQVAQAPQQGGTPRIAVDEPIFDFGRMEVGEKRDHTWTIRNMGDADLEIRNVRPSCGCTNTAVADDIVPPGGTTTLASTLDLPRQTGPVRKNIAIHSNDPQQGTLVVAFVGEATQAIVLDPPVITFQNIEQDEQASRTVEVRATEDDLSFQITGLDFATGQAFGAETETVEEGRHYRVHVSTLPPMAGSHISDYLTIETDHDRVSSLRLTMVANVLSDIVTAPDVLRLNAAHPEAIKRVILLRAGRVTEFTVTGVDLPDPDMEYTVNERQPGMLYIEVDNIVARPELDGTEVVVHLDAPSVPEVRIPITVVGAAGDSAAEVSR